MLEKIVRKTYKTLSLPFKIKDVKIYLFNIKYKTKLIGLKIN